MRSLPFQLRSACPQPSTHSALLSNKSRFPLVNNSNPYIRPRTISRNCRLSSESADLKTESGLHGDLSCSLSSVRGTASKVRTLFRMDLSNEEADPSSVQSRESLPGDVKPSPLHDRPPMDTSPGQLTYSFAKLKGKDQIPMTVARSMPVPVPSRRQRVSVEQDVAVSPKDFIPPHEFSYKGRDEDLIGTDTPTRGLSSLRVRDAVLEQVGYFDGYTELCQKPEHKRTDVTRKNCFLQD